jgi:hypothetical protein
MTKTIEQISIETRQLHYDTYYNKLDCLEWEFTAETSVIDRRLWMLTRKLNTSLNIADFYVRKLERRVINEINQCPL